MNCFLSARNQKYGIVFLIAFVSLTTQATAQDIYQRPPDVFTQLVDAPSTPDVSISPLRTHMLLLDQHSLPSIAELAEPEERLAGMRINPRINGPSRTSSYYKLTLRTVEGRNEHVVSGLPDNARVRNVSWSPDGLSVAFTVDLPDRIDLYVLDVASAQARRLIDDAVNDISSGTPFDWFPDSQALIVNTVPADRNPMPLPPLAPEGPVIQENIGKEAPAPTYQDLLENPYDAELFSYFLTTQLLRVGLDGSTKTLGAPKLIMNAEVAPGGAYLLVESVHRPFSYLVPAYRFPQLIEVLDVDGNLVKEIADLPLAEEVPTGFGSVPTGIRSISWRSDVAATLKWTEALDGGDGRVEADVRDRLYMLEAPFTSAPVPLVTLPLRYNGIQWGNENLALVYDYWWETRRSRTYIIDPSNPGAEPRILFDVSTEDSYNDPGNPVMRLTEQGTSVLLTTDNGTSIFLTGTGASPEGDRPFFRKMNLETGEIDELFRSNAPYYESVVALLGMEPLMVLTRRETTVDVPNYYIRDLERRTPTQVTHFEHPYPELAGIQKEFIKYEREDGVQLTATLYLPIGYDAGRDGPLPTFVWAYPREYKSASSAGQVSGSPNRFTRISYSGAVPYVTQGFAVIDNASMPIIGEDIQEPNDTFREQLVMNANAAIDEGVRRGVVDPERVAIGGHSYGAFMTGNLLAHSDLFRAGIARSGAYNRTLTPFGFQREQRTYWEAPEAYYQMSPFMHADKVNEPILLIHGEADNNSGTFPIQSARFYNALKGMGKTARYIVLPHESHGYRARESVLHMIWEMNRWLEIYVKNAPPRDEEPGTPVEGPTGR